MKKTFHSIFFYFVLCVSVSAQAANPLEVKAYKLSNGLTVWLNEDHSQPKVFGAVLVNAGAKDCPNTGIAHYFEHIMFKGTDKIGTTNYTAEKILLDSIALKYDELATVTDQHKRLQLQKEINALSIRSADYAIPNEYDRLISRYGGSGLNAGTSFDYTVYYNEFSPQYIHQWAEVNSERLLNPVFRLFQSELETVYEEKNMYSDRIGGQAIDKLTERYFAPHPYAYPILGSTENLKNPKLSDMQKFFENYYVAGNMGLIMSGNFNSDELLPILEKTFSRIRKGEAPKIISPAPKPFNGKESFEVKLPIPVVKIMVLGWRGVPANHEDEIKLRIISGLLNNSNKTGYLDKLSSDGKLMEARAMSESLNETGILGVLIIPKLMVQSYSQAKYLAVNQIEKIKRGDFTDEAFNSLKLEQKRNYETELEDIDSRSQKMISLLSTGKSWKEYLNEIKEINDITKEDIVRAANKYFTDNYLEITKKTGNYPKDNLTKPGFAPIIPKNTEAKSEYALQLENVKSDEAKPRFLDFENDAQTVRLAPKTTLYVTPNPVNNIFSMELEFGKGTLASKLISPMGSFVDKLGTDTLSFEKLRNKLQTIGSTMDFSSEKNSFTIHVSGFDLHFDETLALVGNFMKNVSPDAKKLKKVVDEIRINNKTEQQSPDNIAAALLDKVRYGNQSEYLNRLSIAELKNLKGEDLLKEFKLVTKVECNIHYCGNLSVETVVNQVKKNIAVEEIITTSQSPVHRDLLPTNEPLVYFIDAPKSSQSIVNGFLIGAVSPDPSSRHAAALFNNYFGGSMSSLVFQQIREFRSLAYRARAVYRLPYFKHKDKNGQLITQLSTQCDKTLDAMQVMDSLLKLMPLIADRVETSRQDVINDANNDYPTLRVRSSKIASLKSEGYTSDPNQALIDAVSNMNIDNIAAFYDQQIKSRTIAYIVVGNKKKIDMKKLATFGKIVMMQSGSVFK
ncbi:MAG: insulinase family protein [Paludibacter sp.]|nr:insulinase family protein [Paludibacter sp.]